MQKTKKTSLRDAELIYLCDNIASKVLRTKMFLVQQCYAVTEKFVYQGNEAIIKLG
jgi:hypothetical protein